MFSKAITDPIYAMPSGKPEGIFCRPLLADGNWTGMGEYSCSGGGCDDSCRMADAGNAAIFPAAEFRFLSQTAHRAEEQHYLRLAREGDLEARNILIERNLRLVAHIMNKG
jgi:hypothetical protein